MRRPWQFVWWIPLLAAVGCKDAPPGELSVSGPTEPEWFEDITARVGLSFTHDPGSTEDDPYFMPKNTGSGGAAIDFDGDGRIDLYLIHNGGPAGKRNQLFHQQADGTFRDVSAGSGLDVAGWGQGVAIGDVDDDGRPDVLLTEYGQTRLFRNEGGGQFREITRQAGVDNPQWGTSAAFLDFDRDGRLDFVVANYFDYDPAVKCGIGGKPDFCGPQSYRKAPSRLFRNLGPGPDGIVRFEDVTARSRIGTALGKGMGVLCADFDGDGWPDIFVAHDMMENHLWINQRDGTFREEAGARGLAYPEGGAGAANMGIAWADVNGDGLPDLFVTHLVQELHTLWRQGPRGKFRDLTIASGLNRGWRGTGFGCAFVDFDRDGWPDLAWVNGNVYRNRGVEPTGPFWPRYAQRHQLFANKGLGKFRDLSESNPTLCGTPAVGRGLIVADVDNDGAPDLIITQTDGPARVLRNVAPANGHWLTVRAVLPDPVRDACGAEVTVRAGGRDYWRLLHPGMSYCSSHDPRGFFGLGLLQPMIKSAFVGPTGPSKSSPAVRPIAP